MGESREANEFLADVATRMIELALSSEAGCKYNAYAFGRVLEQLAAVPDEDPAHEFATDLVLDIIKTMTYVQIVKVADATDIEQQAEMFREMLDHADELGMKNKNDNEEEPTNGNGND